MNIVEGKKAGAFYVLEVLRRHTDADHPMSQKEIGEMVEMVYNMPMDRKTVRDHLQLLIDLGYNVEYGETLRTKKNGEVERLATDWYFADDFEYSELRMIVDSILFSKSISQEIAKDIIERIKARSTEFFEPKVKHISTLPAISNAGNKQVLLNIEKIDEAISAGKKIAFIYNTYDVDKKLKPRRKEKYLINPYQMVPKDGRYYLICNMDKYDDISNYRIDRMTEVEVVDQPIKDKKLVKGMENGLNLPKHMAEQLFMYSDPAENIYLKVKKRSLGDIVDWFDINFEVLGDGFMKKNFPDITKEKDPDALCIKVACSSKAMLHWAMLYGEEVEVLAPAHLREEMQRATAALAAKYN